MRLGLDLHGVIDDNRAMFETLALSVISYGGEVHIITGSRKDDVLEEIKSFPYTHFFSLSDFHKQHSTAQYYALVDQNRWNATKANYCKENNIDLMIDDSEVYGAHFSTQYLKYNRSSIRI